MRNLDELQSDVLRWADERSLINETIERAKIQVEEKTLEEVHELVTAIYNYDLVPVEFSDEALDAIKRELGDVLVTLIIAAANLGTTTNECLEMAYDKIKTRKGQTINGVFVKEEDL